MTTQLLNERREEARRAFRFYSTLKSTAWIVPILYMYLEKTLRLSLHDIFWIAGMYTVLPFFLEVPLGILADRVGTAKILKLGVVCQLASVLSLIMVPVSMGYHLYLIAIYIAAASFSGADQSFSRDLFGEDEEEEYKSFLHENNGLVYRNSIVMLILGGLAFQLDPRLPLILQAASFAGAFECLSRIPIQRRVNGPESSSVVHDSWKSLRLIFADHKLLALVVITTLFDSAILLNHKVVQQQFDSYLGAHFSALIGFGFALGNISSYQASKWFRANRSRIGGPLVQILMTAFLLAIAYCLLSAPSAFAVLAGFIFLNGFKSIYRPLMDGESMSRIPFSHLRATVLSVISLVSSVGVAAIHLLLANTYDKNIGNGNLAFLALAIPLLMIAALVFLIGRPLRLKIGESPLTGKERVLIELEDEGPHQSRYFLASVYPEDIESEHFEKVARFAASGIYPAFAHSKEEENSSRFSLVCPYLGELHIHQLDSRDQLHVCRSLLAARPKPASSPDPSAHVPRAEEIFSDEAREVLKRVDVLAEEVMIHGDLHPDNILIHRGSPFVIDWDLCGVGPRWFDVLTLLTSPKLNLSDAERLQILQGCLQGLEENEGRLLMSEFSSFKAGQLHHFAIFDQSLGRIAEGYKCNATRILEISEPVSCA